MNNASYDILINHSNKEIDIDFNAIIDDALKYINEICDKYNWKEFCEECFLEKVIIFYNKKEFDFYLKELADIPQNTELPATYSAMLLNKELIIMSPEYYAEVYPDGVEKDSYMKLIAHEIAHELHVRILNREEDKMGPVWFYEGFATYISDQFVENDLRLSSDEMKKIIYDSNRGSYKKYNYLFKHLIKHSNIHEMLKLASQNTITNWALEILDNN